MTVLDRDANDGAGTRLELADLLGLVANRSAATFISGLAGVGKSRLLDRLIEGRSEPFLLARISDLCRSAVLSSERLAESCIQRLLPEKAETGRAVKRAVQSLKDGGLILLDALDEVADPSSAVNLIDHLRATFSNCHLVVSGREWHPQLDRLTSQQDGVRRVEILPYERHELADRLHEMLRGNDRGKAARVADVLKKTIGSWVGIPFFMALAIENYHQLHENMLQSELIKMALSAQINGHLGLAHCQSTVFDILHSTTRTMQKQESWEISEQEFLETNEPLLCVLASRDPALPLATWPILGELLSGVPTFLQGFPPKSLPQEWEARYLAEQGWVDRFAEACITTQASRLLGRFFTRGANERFRFQHAIYTSYCLLYGTEAQEREQLLRTVSYREAKKQQGVLHTAGQLALEMAGTKEAIRYMLDQEVADHVRLQAATRLLACLDPEAIEPFLQVLSTRDQQSSHLVQVAAVGVGRLFSRASDDQQRGIMDLLLDAATEDGKTGVRRMASRACGSILTSGMSPELARQLPASRTVHACETLLAVDDVDLEDLRKLGREILSFIAQYAPDATLDLQIDFLITRLDRELSESFMTRTQEAIKWLSEGLPPARRPRLRPLLDWIASDNDEFSSDADLHRRLELVLFFWRQWKVVEPDFLQVWHGDPDTDITLALCRAFSSVVIHTDIFTLTKMLVANKNKPPLPALIPLILLNADISWVQNVLASDAPELLALRQQVLSIFAQGAPVEDVAALVHVLSDSETGNAQSALEYLITGSDRHRSQNIKRRVISRLTYDTPPGRLVRQLDLLLTDDHFVGDHDLKTHNEHLHTLKDLREIESSRPRGVLILSLVRRMLQTLFPRRGPVFTDGDEPTLLGLLLGAWPLNDELAAILDETIHRVASRCTELWRVWAPWEGESELDEASDVPLVGDDTAETLLDIDELEDELDFAANQVVASRVTTDPSLRWEPDTVSADLIWLSDHCPAGYSPAQQTRQKLLERIDLPGALWLLLRTAGAGSDTQFARVIEEQHHLAMANRRGKGGKRGALEKEILWNIFRAINDHRTAPLPDGCVRELSAGIAAVIHRRLIHWAIRPDENTRTPFEALLEALAFPKTRLIALRALRKAADGFRSSPHVRARLNYVLGGVAAILQERDASSKDRLLAAGIIGVTGMGQSDPEFALVGACNALVTAMQSEEQELRQFCREHLCRLPPHTVLHALLPALPASNHARAVKQIVYGMKYVEQYRWPAPFLEWDVPEWEKQLGQLALLLDCGDEEGQRQGTEALSRLVHALKV